MNHSASRRPHHFHISHIFSVVLHRVSGFVKANTVLCIAALAAIVTSCIVVPDAEYIGYFDFRTLTCLFCTLAVICALKNIRFFTIIARKIVCTTGNLRMAILALVYITFIGSMLIANDMALLTFLPLGFFVLDSTGKRKYMAFTFIMQNIAANLGGMLTPFGNPQNLYLYSEFAIPDLEFITIMFPPFILSVVLITVCCLFVKPEKLELENRDDSRLPIWRTVVYLILFAFSILIVFRAIPYFLGLVLIPFALLFLDRKALARVDYGLLLTFACFFVFAGNMARIPEVREVFSSLLESNTLVVSALSCQFISNVPSAILLSQFTESYRELLVGVNIGGAGTLIASLASLITFREYTKNNPKKTLSYIGLFSAFNFGFLIILLVFESFIL
ncbi:MAG: citrate transporter [Ruminococcaceae bacterium]|nr:citrate transporter [Oscillospiraceae bacterium]